MLEQLQKQEFVDSILSAGRNLLFLVSPNFEDRSTRTTDWLAPELAKYPDRHSKIFFNVVSLQGAHPPEMLDVIKSENVSQVLTTLVKHSIPHKHQVLTHPIPDPRSFYSDVEGHLREMGQPIDLIIDISCFPRRILFHLLNFLFSISPTSGLGAPKLENIYFLYTWADRYPTGLAPEFVGEIKSYLSGKSFREMLLNTDEAHVCIFTSGTSYDANLAYEQTLSGVNANISRTIFVLMQKTNVLQSLKHVYAHHFLITEARSTKKDGIEFVFSPVDAAFRLQKTVEGLVDRHVTQQRSLFAVAPFGPKPLGLVAYLAVAHYQTLLAMKNSHEPKGDIIYMSGAQYMSVYSIGWRETSIYKIPEESPLMSKVRRVSE